MNQTYKYRPPVQYLILGIPVLLISAVFVYMIGKEDLWISIIFSILALVFFTFGGAYIAIFLNKFNVGGLVLGTDFIEIPGRWKNRTKLNFSEIKDIGEIDTYDHVIEIVSENGLYLIEKKWMKKKDFYRVRDILMEWTKENFTEQNTL